MLTLITGTPGSGKTLYAVSLAYKYEQTNIKHLPLNPKIYARNCEKIALNSEKLVLVDINYWLGDQPLFVSMRETFNEYDQQMITVDYIFSLFQSFNLFSLQERIPNYFYDSLVYNLLLDLIDKSLDLKLEKILEVRTVYSDINGLRIENVLKSPDDWRECPDGSVIFYDEIQYRKEYQNTREKNQMILDLSRHRHRGFDIYAITQFPTLLHTDFRSFIGQHHHLHRGWGLPSSTVYIWAYVVIDPNSKGKKALAERDFRFNFPKKLYKVYTSATTHTHKMRIPAKLLFFVGIGVVGLALNLRSCSHDSFLSKLDKDDKNGFANQVKGNAPKSPVAGHTASDPAVTQSAVNQNAQLSLLCRKAENLEKPECKNWFDQMAKTGGNVSQDNNAQYISYNPNEPYSVKVEPLKYQVINQPKFSGCVKFGNKYKAYTEQGTYLKVSQSDCKKILVDSGNRPYDYFSQRNKVVTDNSAVSNHNDSVTNNIDSHDNNVQKNGSLDQQPSQVHNIPNNPTFSEKDITKPSV
ncbi:zonular occludens toxin domain-containing protein [Acinetobacter sp. ANC 4641]|uniref:zonular occludens toxin domain-containing protein n=1 Tax=Acinetobacter sp. ANC 4641 TaxID=2529847 RepID=UPI001040831F|nr:zonular occludens toxin domain-containing protein [Acinetobacter sp. ANC 4641]TCB05666.1 zonula occludens toxin [Acinetobacter sp. ANC 4641]